MRFPALPIACTVRRQCATTESGQTMSTESAGTVGASRSTAAQAVMVLPRPTSSARRKPARFAFAASRIAFTPAS